MCHRCRQPGRGRKSCLHELRRYIRMEPKSLSASCDDLLNQAVQCDLTGKKDQETANERAVSFYLQSR